MTAYADLINRSALLHHLDECIPQGDASTTTVNAVLTAIRAAVEQMPSVEPSAEPGVEWHKITTRPLTKEEAEYYSESIDYVPEYMFDCEMPEDGEEILVATNWGGTDTDVCDRWDFMIGLEKRGDWDGVIAWAQMPTYRVKVEVEE